MPTTYTNGLKLPDLGSIDWYNSYKNNIDILDPIVGTVNGVATTYAPISHNHSASEITSGTIDIARLPPAALERMHIVADQTARYALTTSTVQEGDTVKQTDTGVMYLVVDSTKLNSADGYTEYSAGTASKAIADEDGTSIKTGYGKLASTNTWGNTQTVTGNDKGWNIINPNIEKGVIPSANKSSFVWWADKNNNFLGRICSRVHTDGTTMLWLSSLNYYKNGALDPTGSSVTTSLILGVDANAYKFVQTNADFRPDANNTSNLGTSTNQWKSVYAQSYYYNGTAWGLDKENTWTDTQTYSTGSYGQMIWLKNTGLDLSVNGNTGLSSAYQHVISWVDKNNTRYSSVQSWTNNVENVLVLRSYYRTDANTVRNSSIRNQCTANAKRWYPESDADTDLGTSTSRWKTLNGVNPGALSLPDIAQYVDLTASIPSASLDGNTGIDLSSYITSNGWLSIVVPDTNADDFIFVQTGTNLSNRFFMSGAKGNGFISLMMPINRFGGVNAQIKASSVSFCRFYPCLGNV